MHSRYIVLSTSPLQIFPISFCFGPKADIRRDTEKRKCRLALRFRRCDVVGLFLIGERRAPSANMGQMSIRSAMLKASSSSTPR